MSNILGPSDKESLQHVDQELGDLINEMENGKENVGLLFHIGQQIALLSTNEHIPVWIKEKLHLALQDLQHESINHLDLSSLIAAKEKVDATLKKPAD